MADVTVLRCWPACVDAIDWSPDGIIALASDERIELLVCYILWGKKEKKKTLTLSTDCPIVS